jgi:hypothetical protein
MVGRLMTLPLRVGVRGAQLWLRAAEEVAGRATVSALRVASVFMRNGQQQQQQRGSSTATQPRQRRRPVPDPRVRVRRPEPSHPEPVSAEDAAARIERAPGLREQRTPPPQAPHVSEEPELVREEAEPGAEEGAGPRLVVQEPWEGYARMSARDVIARLAGATAAELAAVSLYESANRSRQTVLDAVQRQLRTANGGGSHE